MKWIGRRESENVEDRRRISGGHIALGGGAIGLIFLLIQFFMGGDPSLLINQAQQQIQQTQSADAPVSAEDDEMAKYVKVVLADNEDVWNKLFAQMGKQYDEPRLILFRGATESGCGNASSSMGPFYCPDDKKVYMDLAFFDELKNKFGAKGGDFAIAYVISHEVGHHVQNLLGTSGRIHRMQESTDDRHANRLSVAIELQADFYAGVWAHHNEEMNKVLEDGDIEEALSAANAVGDDMIQKKMQGYTVPDAFTHGTAAQRMFWFKKGFDSGDMNQGNTFDEIN